MIDTLRVQWSGIRWCENLAEWIRSEWPESEQHTRWYDVNLPWDGMSWKDPVLGQMGVKSNRMGNYLWVERSLPKFMHGDNCRVLSSAECIEAVRALLSSVEGRFADWWEYPNPREGSKVQRVDLCYQQPVPCSAELFPYIARSMNSRKVVKHQVVLNPVAVHLNGISMNQNKLEHVRWYDKGIESGNESYLNVVRHEEQLRNGKAGYFIDIKGEIPSVNVKEAIDRMNDRYGSWGELEVYDLKTLLRVHKNAGLASALLVLHPEYEELVRQELSNGSFYKFRNLAMEWRRNQIPVDLRLSSDAWKEPMVL